MLIDQWVISFKEIFLPLGDCFWFQMPFCIYTAFETHPQQGILVKELMQLVVTLSGEAINYFNFKFAYHPYPEGINL